MTMRRTIKLRDLPPKFRAAFKAQSPLKPKRPRKQSLATPAQPSATFDGVTLTVVLPHPPAILNLNGRPGHWAQRSRPTKALRELTYAIVWNVVHGQAPLWGNAIYDIAVFYVTVPRHVDADGWDQRLKAARDALQDAQVVLNDSGLRLGTVTFAKDANKRVEMTVRKI